MAFLIDDLAPARKKPVDKNLGRVRMGRLIDNGDGAGASSQTRHFLKVIVVDEIDGKSLGFGLGCKSVSAKRAQSHFSYSYPVEGLLVLPAEDDIHLAEKPPNEFRAQLWMIIEVAQFACAKAWIARVQADNFPFPLGMKEIPIRLELSALASFVLYVTVKPNVPSLTKMYLRSDSI